MTSWSGKRDMLGDEPPYLAVGTEVSAKYKGAFCEAKIRKVVRSVKCKVQYKQGLGSATVADDQIKGVLRNGAVVEVRHSERKELLEATITKIQDCSQYTVVFDDGDITTLRRTALCLKSGRHFAESETLDQLPLTHPEHFSTPVIGGRRGRRNRIGDGSSDEDESVSQTGELNIIKEEDIGRVVCVEGSEKRKQKDNWFPGLVVAPTAQDTVEIHVKDEYLVRSFKDGRYYTVPKNEATEFTREIGAKVDNNTLKTAVEKALLFLDRGELPPHWDRELLLYGLNDSGSDTDPGDCESSDDEPREEKDHFVAQLYKFMDDSGTPINKGPTIGSKDVDLYRLFKVVQNLGGYNRVTNHNNWKTISHKIGFGGNPMTVSLVKQSYKRFLYSFEEFYRKLGCTMINHPRLSRNRNRSSRSLIRDRDRAPIPLKPEEGKPGSKLGEKLPQTQPPEIDVKPPPELLLPPLPTPPIVENPKLTYPTLKDKILQKKSGVDPSPFIMTKIKEEKQEIEAKTDPKEIPRKETKQRQTKNKNNETDAPVTKTENKEKDKDNTPVKEKKKRIFLRVPVKKDTPKTPKQPPVTKPATSSLAITRQKRIIKEKVKGIVENMKERGAKCNTSMTIPETSAKPHGVKSKAKDDSSTHSNSKSNRKEESTTHTSEEKKKGRKRKEKSDGFDDNFAILPPYKVINVGDKLKVYYGPTHESKVTYEAKVLNIREEGGEKLYLVHYTGWNTRYDEWIKINRIADNLSWSGGRQAKKSVQTPKASKKKTAKVEPITIKTEPVTTSTVKEPTTPSTRQGSVGRCTTPSSLISSASRKCQSTRAFTRAIGNKRELSASETEHEYESDCAELESRNGKTEIKEEPGEKRRKKKKLENEFQPAPMEPKLFADDEDVPYIRTRATRKNSFEKNLEKDNEMDLSKVTIKVEDKDEEEEEEVHPLFSETPVMNFKEEETTDSLGEQSPLKGFDMSALELEQKREDRTLLSNLTSKFDEEKITLNLEELPSRGRDFDLSQIRSELKGIETTVSPNLFDDKEDSIKTMQLIKDELKETEDVYEFKEPEPFEFEARKPEEKCKLSRRNIGGRLFEDSKVSSKPVIQVVSPLKSSKSPSSSPNQSPKKDDNVVENIVSTIHTCEEAFDKICASPLRAATEHRRHINLPIFGIPAENSDDDFDDDSQDRLVISERDSDNYSTVSNEKDEPSEEVTQVITETINDDKNQSLLAKFEVTLEAKENFPREDDEDLEEDEAINDAIQRAIQDTSDDTNDGDLLNKNLDITTQVIPQVLDTTCYETQCTVQDLKTLEPIPIVLQTVSITTEIEPQKTTAVTVEEIVEEVQETLEIEVDKKDLEGIHLEVKEDINDVHEVEEMSIVEEIEEGEADDEELEVEVHEDDELELNVERLDIECTDVGEAIICQIPSKESSDEQLMITESEAENSTKMEEEEEEEESEETNIVSLLCEETIPRSPTPQTEIVEQIEEIPMTSASVIRTEVAIIPEIAKDDPIEMDGPIVVAKDAVPVMDNTPPTTPDSSISSLPSPRVAASPPPLDNESTKSQRDSEVETENNLNKKENTESAQKPSPEPRQKKQETSRSAGKKGRRPRKRSEETGKRKYSRNSRHQGSDSDDNSEGPNQSRRDSPRPHRFNFTLNLDPEMTTTQRIVKLQQTLQEIRKAYTDVKSELASIDRRRKKLRRRERESAAAAAAAAASASNTRFH